MPAANSPAICVRAPIASLTAVRAPLAPIENACVKPAAAFAAPITSSSCEARTCSPRRPAKARAVRISSAKETRKTPSAAGASSGDVGEPAASGASDVAGRSGSGRPSRSRAQRSRMPTRRRSRRRRRAARRGARNEAAQEEQGGERDGAHRDRRSAHVAQLSRHLASRCSGSVASTGTPSSLPSWRDHEHHRDAVQVADQHRAREVVGDPAEPKQPREQEAGGDEQREHRRELDRVRRCRRRRAAARRPPRASRPSPPVR